MLWPEHDVKYYNVALYLGKRVTQSSFAYSPSFLLDKANRISLNFTKKAKRRKKNIEKVEICEVVFVCRNCERAWSVAAKGKERCLLRPE